MGIRSISNFREIVKPLKLTMEQIAEKFNAEKIEVVNYEK